MIGLVTQLLHLNYNITYRNKISTKKKEDNIIIIKKTF